MRSPPASDAPPSSLRGASGTQSSSLRGASGTVCPRCRYRSTELAEGKLATCPRDGRVLVRASALAEADGDPFLGMLVGGRFAVLELLGSGSMATVYRARHEAMRRDVALKIVRSDRLADAHAKRRFEREAHAMSLLTSPHTATVFDFGEIKTDDDPEFIIDGSLYLAMELLAGESLGTRLKRSGPLPVSDAVRVVRHALRSLAEAHDKGIIHRDLKPDNLVLVPGREEEGEICKVLDFGIAKLVSRAEGVDVLETQAGTVFGTPRYMSPEQAQGKPLDARSDLYALGVILYHALAGRAPYTDRDAVVVMAHHIKTPPPPLSEIAPDAGIPKGLEALVMRTLSKNPSDRPQTALQFIRALDPFVDDATAGSGELTAVLGLGRLGVSSRRLVLGAAVAAAIGGTVGGGLLVVRSQVDAAVPARTGLSAAIRSIAGRAHSAAAARLTDAWRQRPEAGAEAGPDAAAPSPAAGGAPPIQPPRSPAVGAGKGQGKPSYERFDRL